MTSVNVNNTFLALSVEGGTVAVNFSGHNVEDQLFLPNSRIEKGRNEVHDGAIFLTCCAFSSTAKYLAFCFYKELHVYEVDGWKLICKKELKRAASSVQFSPKSDKIIVADKSGDVYLFEVEKLEEEDGHLLLGHVSMILDVLITRDERFILTCDRDEKIRVSKFPNSYTIQSFCLGHKEFVMTISLLSHNEELLVSGSGDGTIRIWDFINGKQLLIHDCSERNENGPQAVLKIVSLKLDAHSSLICTTVRNLTGIIVYKIISDVDKIRCSYHQTIILASEPVAMCLNKSCDNIWVIEPSYTVALFRAENSKLVTFSTGTVEKINLVLKKHANILCNMISSSKIVGCFYKKVFDNVEDYFKRKMDRIEQSNKKSKTDINC